MTSGRSRYQLLLTGWIRTSFEAVEIDVRRLSVDGACWTTSNNESHSYTKWYSHSMTFNCIARTYTVTKCWRLIDACLHGDNLPQSSHSSPPFSQWHTRQISMQNETLVRQRFLLLFSSKPQVLEIVDIFVSFCSLASLSCQNWQRIYNGSACSRKVLANCANNCENV